MNIQDCGRADLRRLTRRQLEPSASPGVLHLLQEIPGDMVGHACDVLSERVERLESRTQTGLLVSVGGLAAAGLAPMLNAGQIASVAALGLAGAAGLAAAFAYLKGKQVERSLADLQREAESASRRLVVDNGQTVQDGRYLDLGRFREPVSIHDARTGEVVERKIGLANMVVREDVRAGVVTMETGGQPQTFPGQIALPTPEHPRLTIRNRTPQGTVTETAWEFPAYAGCFASLRFGEHQATVKETKPDGTVVLRSRSASPEFLMKLPEPPAAGTPLSKPGVVTHHGKATGLDFEYSMQTPELAPFQAVPTKLDATPLQVTFYPSLTQVVRIQTREAGLTLDNGKGDVLTFAGTLDQEGVIEGQETRQKLQGQDVLVERDLASGTLQVLDRPGQAPCAALWQEDSHYLTLPVEKNGNAYDCLVPVGPLQVKESIQPLIPAEFLRKE